MPKKSLLKRSFAYYKKHFDVLLITSLSFLIVLSAVFMIEAISPFTLILSIPLIIIPYLFCIISFNFNILVFNNGSLQLFYRPFRIGISPFVRKIYRPFRQYLFSLLVFLGTLFFASFVLALLGPYFFPDFKAVTDGMTDLMINGADYEVLYEYIILNMDVLFNYYKVILSLGSFFGALYFFIKISHSSFAVLIGLAVPPSFTSISKTHHENFKKHKKSFNKDLWRYQGLTFLLAFLGFIISLVLNYFLILDYEQLPLIIAINLIGTFFFPALLFPTYVFTIYELSKKYQKEYLINLAQDVQTFMQEIDQAPNLNQEMKDKIKDEMQKALDRFNEEKAPDESEDPPN